MCKMNKWKKKKTRGREKSIVFKSDEKGQQEFKKSSK